MTAIFYGHITEAMVAISDRRLTRGNIAVSSDTSKVVKYPGFWFHYTGLAEIDGVPTDEWLAQKLAGRTHLPSALHHVRKEATVAFRRMPSSWDKRHAFYGVGWAPAGGELGAAEPVVLWVTNYAAPGVRPGPAQDEFVFYHSIMRRHLPPEVGTRFTKMHISGPVSDSECKRISRQLNRITARIGVPDVPNAVRLLAHEMRGISTPSGPVGGGQFITVLPHPRLTSGRVWLTLTATGPHQPSCVADYFKDFFAIPPNAPSYLYIPADLNNPPFDPPIPRSVEVDSDLVGWDVADLA